MPHRTDSLITSLMMYCINTGLLTGISTIGCIIAVRALLFTVPVPPSKNISHALLSVCRLSRHIHFHRNVFHFGQMSVFRSNKGFPCSFDNPTQYISMRCWRCSIPGIILRRDLTLCPARRLVLGNHPVARLLSDRHSVRTIKWVDLRYSISVATRTILNDGLLS